MNALYNHGVKQTHTLQRELASFEKNLSTSPMSLQGSITTTLTAFKKTVREYNDLVLQSSLSEEKHHARLEKFNKELTEYQSKFDTLKRQREEHLQANNQQELMGRRHTTGDNPYGSEHAARQAPSNLSYQEGLFKEKQSLSRGSQQLDQILEMGQSAFEDLVEQNETLKKIGSTFLQSLLTLGVSQGTIRTIERRARQDKWLFWGAVILLFVMFYYMIKWFH